MMSKAHPTGGMAVRPRDNRHSGPPGNNLVNPEKEIERLRSDLAMLHGLDITSREGQQTFNEWRNRSVNDAK